MPELPPAVRGFGVTCATMFKKVVTEEYPEQADRYPPKPRFHGRHQLNRMDGASEGPLASIDQNGCEPFSTTIACVIVVLVFALDVPGQPGSLTCVTVLCVVLNKSNSKLGTGSFN